MITKHKFFMIEEATRKTFGCIIRRSSTLHRLNKLRDQATQFSSLCFEHTNIKKMRELNQLYGYKTKSYRTFYNLFKLTQAMDIHNGEGCTDRWLLYN